LIDSLIPQIIKFSKASKNVTLGFVFTGQGAQWYAMGRELIIQYPIFRESLVQAEKCLDDLGASWSLTEELMTDADTSRVGKALLSQPICTAIQIALVDLLSSWNVKPASVTGHSSGEIAAAYAAGVLSRESALAVAYHRGVAAAQIKHVKELRSGAMLAVGLPVEETETFISSVENGIVNIACINSPSSVTVSGDESGIDELFNKIQQTGAFTRKLAVDTAYHSYHMKYVAESYLNALQDLPITIAGEVEIYSSVSGQRIQPSYLDAEYWVANLVSPVQFSQSLQNLCLGSGSKRRKRRGAKAAVDVVVEIGPHSTLSGPIKQNLQANDKLSSASIDYLSVLVRNQNAVETSLGVAGSLFRKGIEVDLHAVNCPTSRQSNKVLVDLPPYPWNHSTSFWANPLTSPAHLNGGITFPRNDFLGILINEQNSLEPRWRNIMRLSEIPWMQDHNIQSNTVCPAACYLAMAIEASYQRATLRGTEVIGYRLRELTIGHALVFSQAIDEVEIMLSLRPFNESVRFTSDAWDEFCISSSVDGSAWTEHCRGLILIEKLKTTTEVDGGREAREQSKEYDQMIVDFEEACTKEVDTHEIYTALKVLGLNFGPTFANMRGTQVGADKCVTEVLIPDTAAVMPAKFQYPFILHPATLDSFIHAVFPIGESYQNADQGTPVPTFIEEMFVSHNIAKEPGHSFKVYAKGEKKDLGNSARKALGRTVNYLHVFDSKQVGPEPVVIVTGLAFSTLPRESSSTSEQAEKLCHQIQWDAAPEFLTAQQFDKLATPFRLPTAVKDQGQLIQQGAFYYAENAVKLLALEEIPETESHLRKLYGLVQRHCEDVYSGRSGVFETSSWLNVDEASRTEICRAVLQTPYEILCHVGEALPQILRNEIDPLSIMMEDNRLERHYKDNQLLAQSYEQVAVYIQLLANKNPFLNVLEIGAGTGGATFSALKAMTGPDGPRFANYDFTDISPGFFEKVTERVQHHLPHLSDLINFRKLDIEDDPKEQGYELGSYDLIIAANVLHATKNMKETMTRVRSLLKPGGKLVLFEITVKNLAASIVFGTLPGWWVGEEPGRQQSPLSTEEEWNALLLESNFSGLDATLWDTPDVEDHNVSAMVSTAIEDTKPTYPTEVTIIAGLIQPEAYVSDLQILLQTLGVSSTLSSFEDCDPKGKVCIVLSELTHPVLRDPTSASFNAVKMIFIESSGTLWVTRGAHMESVSPDLNLATGIARTVRAEKGDTMLVTLDLDPQGLSIASPRSVADAIFAVFKRNFCLGSIEFPNLDTEYLIRDDVVMIPRVVEDKKLTSFIASTTGTPVPEDQPFLQPSRQLRAEITTPGFLDSLQFVDDERMSGPLQHDYVEIEVKAIGLNFRDVMSASGQIDPYPLGCECSGVVTAAGKSVQDFVVGDHVISNVLGGCVSNFVRSPAVGAEHIPQDMPFHLAASLPVIYFTAYYAVMKIARLSKGETILIHAAAGGLGQAIINLAQLVGAEIFATVGTLEKKKLLVDRFDIPDDHIFSSRDNTFAKGVMRRTGGRGVDVIMNSLSGDALRQTWNCIAPFGRFIELGKRDFTINSRLEMKHFEKNVSFTGLDVPLHTNFAEKRRIWGEIMYFYQRGEIKHPYPITMFGISEIEKAMRIMQTGKHSGKLVILPKPDEVVKVLPMRNSGNLFNADASYLLIGGLGGIGRALAFWMAEQGAQHLIFASPSGLEKEKARECVALLEEKGINVTVFKCDVAKLKDVERMVDESGMSIPPIRGMIHTAMVPKVSQYKTFSSHKVLTCY
jgi:acyl transferase domain-containing protein/NADPH:quinone reductase-like Zn-dependent oxidoreductase